MSAILLYFHVSAKDLFTPSVSNTALIEINDDAERGCNILWSDSIDFSESCIAGVIAVLTLRWRWRLV